MPSHREWERAREIGRLSCDGQMSAFRRALVLHVDPVSGGMTGTTDAAPHYFEFSLAAEERAPSDWEERCWRWAGQLRRLSWRIATCRLDAVDENSVSPLGKTSSKNLRSSFRVSEVWTSKCTGTTEQSF